MKSIYLCLSALAVLSGVAKAETSPAAVSELVVVANRTPEPADQVGQQVSVVDAAQIKARQAVVVSDLLSATPGVGVTRNGGVGGVTAVRIRGAESDQTVVAIDGVKLNDPSAPGGGYNAGDLLIGDIDRIEVLRGAQSTLWGSQALGGVISITTKAPTAPFEGSASVEAGSLGTGYGRVGVGGKTDRLSWRLAASSYVTDGVSAFRGGREADGYSNSALSGRARVELVPGVSLDLRGTWSRGRTEADGFPPPFFSFGDTAEYGVTKTLTSYAGLNFDLAGGRLQNRIAYSYTDTDRRTFDPNQAVTAVTFDAVGRNARWEYQGVLALPAAWQASFGMESERSSLRTAAPNAFDPHPTADRARALLTGIYAQAIGPVATDVTLTVGLRHDHHDRFGDQDLGQIAAAWRPGQGATVVRASFGQGFKAPTLFQLYSDFGNRGLRPEAANSWDAGIERRFDVAASMVSATWFQRRTVDQIDFASCTATSAPALCRPGGIARFGYYDNIARTSAHGIELAGSARLGGLSLDGDYTWTHTENDAQGSPNRGKPLPRRPEQQANLTASWSWTNGATVSTTLRHVGSSFDDAGASVRLKAFDLVDLRASTPLTGRVEVYGRIENLLDRRYETTHDYGTLGRTATLGLRTAF